jgi:hypothetical protein
MLYFIILANFARKRDPAIYDISSTSYDTSQRGVVFSDHLLVVAANSREIETERRLLDT